MEHLLAGVEDAHVPMAGVEDAHTPMAGVEEVHAPMAGPEFSSHCISPQLASFTNYTHI